MAKTCGINFKKMPHHFFRKNDNPKNDTLCLPLKSRALQLFFVLLKRWTLNNDPWIERNSSIDLRCKEAIICSISHAWEAREHPDPCGHQLPGSMPHALEYVIIQHAIFMPIPKFYADQIDGSRSSGILQGDSG